MTNVIKFSIKMVTNFVCKSDLYSIRKGWRQPETTGDTRPIDFNMRITVQILGRIEKVEH